MKHIDTNKIKIFVTFPFARSMIGKHDFLREQQKVTDQ